MIRINLLGHAPTKPKKKKRAAADLPAPGGDNAVFVGAIAATVVALAGFWWWQSGRLADLRERHQEVTAEQQELADIAAQVQEMEDRRAIANQKLGVIVDLKKSQSGPVLLFDQISRELPDSLWLTDITLNEGQVQVAGQALSEVAVSDFDMNLRLSSYFADNALQFIQASPGGESVSFQISTRFVPLTPIQPPAEEAPAGGARGGRGGRGGR